VLGLVLVLGLGLVLVPGLGSVRPQRAIAAAARPRLAA